MEMERPVGLMEEYILRLHLISQVYMTGIEIEEVDGFECLVDGEELKSARAVYDIVLPVPYLISIEDPTVMWVNYSMKIHDRTPGKRGKWDVGNGQLWSYNLITAEKDGNL